MTVITDSGQRTADSGQRTADSRIRRVIHPCVLPQMPPGGAGDGLRRTLTTPAGAGHVHAAGCPLAKTRIGGIDGRTCAAGPPTRLAALGDDLVGDILVNVRRHDMAVQQIVLAGIGPVFDDRVRARLADARKPVKVRR